MYKKVALLGLFTALALVFSYIEAMIPVFVSIPGIKLGITNIVVVLLMYCVGEKEAITVSVIRIILAGFMFGNLFSIIYSLAGGVLSFVVMLLLKKSDKLKCLSVSMAGGIFHNIGQIIVAALVVENFKILFYIPVLLVAGAITGLVIGILSQEIIIRIKDLI